MNTPELARAVIKEELVVLTGKYQLAIVLNQMIYWAQRRRDADNFLQEEVERIKKYAQSEEEFKGLDKEMLKSHGWIYKKAEELSEETMIGVKPKAMREYLKELVENGWLDQRRNPLVKMDRTLQYRVNLTKIQRDLNHLGYHLEGYKMLRHTSGEKENTYFPEENTKEQKENRTVEKENTKGEKEARKGEKERAIPEITTEITYKDTITTKTTSSLDDFEDFDKEDDVDILANKFIQLRAKGLMLKVQDYKSISKVLSEVPLKRALVYLEDCFNERSDSEIRVFSYCEAYIIDRYKTELARLEAKKAALLEPNTVVPEEKFGQDSQEMKLTQRLLERIRLNNPEFKEPNLQVWAYDMNAMISQDKRNPENIAKAIDWCQSSSFWKTHILSVASLREKYDRLVVAATSDRQEKKFSKNVKRDSMPKWYKESEDKPEQMVVASTTEEGKSFEEMLREARDRKVAGGTR